MSYLYNGEILNQKKVSLGLDSSLLMSGSGLFETILFMRGKLYFWQEHLNRLTNSLNFFQVKTEFPLPTYDKVMAYLANLELPEICRVKLVLFPVDSTDKWHWFISAFSYTPPKSLFSIEVEDSVFDYPLLKHKTVNYWSNIRSIQSANPTSEIVRLNRFGKVNEGVKSNVLLVKDQVCSFVALENNYLKGISQQIITENYALFGFNSIVALSEGFSLEDFRAADLILLTNSLMPVVGVKEVLWGDEVVKKEVNLTLIEEIKNRLLEM